MEKSDEKEHGLLSPDFLKKLEALRFYARRIHRSRSRGEHPAPARGMSLEFTDYRKYNPGDDFRYIDWNAFSRLERLFLKVFTAEEDIIIHLLIDVSGSMGTGRPPKLSYAAQLAMALAYVGLNNYDRVGAASFSQGVQGIAPPARGRSAISQLYRFFSALQSVGMTQFNESMSQFTARTGRPGLVFLLSDMLDEKGCNTGLGLLRHAGNDVVLVHLLADDDLNPEYAGPLLLTDSESRRRRNVLANRNLLETYGRRFNEFAEGIKNHCIKCGIEYHSVTSSNPVEELVLRYLRQGRHLY